MDSDERLPHGAGPAGLPPGGQVRRLGLLGVRGQVTLGREFTRRALDDWHIQDGEDVLLLVSELLANAVLHAGGAHELLLHASPERLRVEVRDGGPGVPCPRSPGRPDLPGGHGLHIVDKLADRWGTDSSPDGKSVWLEIDTSRPRMP
ncbi:ATP-binding protein [Streptomyces tateyamensis]|uniref:ATP-binding protein n=1 Tax=Streptomyces tateyamensis TaxID=565073 RepID=A0A2V4N6N2_9ACTN|nr:ATP-binding protein [Streptomyces tateyamensis]PYC79981.1 ATP-binding protein [Streptomyces tateyamensis]